MHISRLLAAFALALPFSGGCPTARAAASATLAVDITALHHLPQRQLESLQRETERVWRPYGIAIRWSTGQDLSLPGDCARLTIVVNPPAGEPAALVSRSGAPLLGAVVFEAGALAANDQVLLSVDAIVGAVRETMHYGRRVRDWPAATMHELSGRALGRVLAHELGHYLIAWRGHADAGLMRASFDPALLISPDTARLQLAPLLIPRLRARLAELSDAAVAAQARRIIRPQPEVSDGNPAEPAGIRPTRPTPLSGAGGSR